jgi:hypothetical protein
MTARLGRCRGHWGRRPKASREGKRGEWGTRLSGRYGDLAGATGAAGAGGDGGDGGRCGEKGQTVSLAGLEAPRQGARRNFVERPSLTVAISEGF